jgi:excisionase family DNA binding protein
MTSPARTAAAQTGLRRAPPAPGVALVRPGPNPYSVREAAVMLGVSRDAIETNYAQLEGVRVGRRILIPRRVVDRLVWGPPDGQDAQDGQDGDATPVIERVLALLPLLARDERVQVAQAALAAAQEV